MHGVGGRTVLKIRHFDLPVVAKIQPTIVILEVGTNDLVYSRPESVGSMIHDLVGLLLVEFSVRVVGVCHVLPRRGELSESFNRNVPILNKYLDVVFDEDPRVFTWRHKGFSLPDSNFYLPDGVHANSLGQYALYRSYRGAILTALKFLQ